MNYCLIGGEKPSGRSIYREETSCQNRSVERYDRSFLLTDGVSTVGVLESAEHWLDPDGVYEAMEAKGEDERSLRLQAREADASALSLYRVDGDGGVTRLLADAALDGASFVFLSTMAPPFDEELMGARVGMLYAGLLHAVEPCLDKALDKDAARAFLVEGLLVRLFGEEAANASHLLYYAPCGDASVLPAVTDDLQVSVEEAMAEFLSLWVQIPEGTTVVTRDMIPRDTAVVSLPEGVEAIGALAFSGCYRLKEILLPQSLEEIGDGAFQDSGLQYVRIPAQTRRIGKGAFGSCLSLARVRLAEGLEGIGEGAFSGTPIREITLPESLTTLGRGAFLGCKRLTELTAYGGADLADNALYGCTALCGVSLAAGVKRIGISAFSDCRALSEIDLPEGLERIESDAFVGCYGLQRVRIPRSVTYIGGKAFFLCRSLTTIEFEGDEAAWNAVKKGYGWAPKSEYTMVYLG